MTARTYKPGANSDCAWYRMQTAAWVANSDGFVFGAYSSSYYKYGSAVRFVNVDIIDNATIVSAYLKLTARTATAGTGCKGRIFAEATDDAPTFADSEAQFLTRESNKTTAYVNWDNPSSWSIGAVYTSPDISAVIQEIIDRPGWASGNDLVLFIDDYDDRSTHSADNWRDAYSYKGGGAANCPRLEVVYSTMNTVQTFPRRLATSDALDFLTSD